VFEDMSFNSDLCRFVCNFLANPKNYFHHIRTINLNGCLIGDAGIQILAQSCLKFTETLVSVSLRHNRMTSVSAETLFCALEDNCSIVELDLGCGEGGTLNFG
jgi:hypothetical protein